MSKDKQNPGTDALTDALLCQYAETGGKPDESFLEKMENILDETEVDETVVIPLSDRPIKRQLWRRAAAIAAVLVVCATIGITMWTTTYKTSSTFESQIVARALPAEAADSIENQFAKGVYAFSNTEASAVEEESEMNQIFDSTTLSVASVDAFSTMDGLDAATPLGEGEQIIIDQYGTEFLFKEVEEVGKQDSAFTRHHLGGSMTSRGFDYREAGSIAANKSQETRDQVIRRELPLEQSNSSFGLRLRGGSERKDATISFSEPMFLKPNERGILPPGKTNAGGKMPPLLDAEEQAKWNEAVALAMTQSVGANATVTSLAAEIDTSQSDMLYGGVSFGTGKLEWTDGPDPTLLGRALNPVGSPKFSTLVDNPWNSPRKEPLSTFSIDVDTASWTNVRGMIAAGRAIDEIPNDAVRIEEWINYFDWDYPQPEDEHPFAFATEVASSPWDKDNLLLRIGVQGKEIERSKRPSANLVFLLDVSGSMNHDNKLPLVKKAISILTEELDERDHVSMVVYAGAEGVALQPTSGSNQKTILDALGKLNAGGSTNGGAGIKLAYKLAQENFIEDGINRVILCTDGDFNVGITGNESLVQLVERKAKGKVFLSVCGFGDDNLNDSMLEEITNKGNGNYYFIDTQREARKVFLEDMMGTLVTIAKDVKIQVEFNPSQVAGYRLIGYANRKLAAEDFENDAVDAGEVGSGHSVTALYEIIPAGGENDPRARVTSTLRYQEDAAPKRTLIPSGELALLKLRYKRPKEDTSIPMEQAILPNDQSWEKASDDFRFSAAVALLGMKIRDHDSVADVSAAQAARIAEGAIGQDIHGYKQEFATLAAKISPVEIASEQSERILAVVGGKPIYQKELDRYQRWQKWNGKPVEGIADLDGLIDQVVLLHRFEKIGGQIDPKFIEQALDREILERFGGSREAFHANLKNAGLSVADHRKLLHDQIVEQALISKKLSEVKPSPAEKKRLYEELKALELSIQRNAPPIEEMEERILSRFRSQRRGEIRDQWIQELRNAAKIQLHQNIRRDTGISF